MIRILSLLPLLCSTFLIKGQETDVIKKDFNQDGTEDRLECFQEWGNNFGGIDCKLIDGKTQEVFELKNYGCYCEMKAKVLVDPELMKSKNASFLMALSKKVLPPVNSTSDASLKWIIASSYSTTKRIDSSAFEFIFNPKTTWQKGEPEFPSTYTVEMRIDSLIALIPEEKVTSIENYSEIGYLVYHGKTHLTHNRILAETTEFITATENHTYQILKTKHGVVAKKDDSYKWLFVTDMHSNDAPQKLRWESIKKVILQDKYLIIKQSLAPDPEYTIYVLDIETGVGGQLKIDHDALLNMNIEITDLSSEERFSIKENNIVIGNKDFKLKFPLEKIKHELDMFSKGN